MNVEASLRHKLLWRIHRRYQTVMQPVWLCGREFSFTRIADPDRVLDQVAEAEDRREKLTGHRVGEPLHLPYWAELWDSALGLGQFLIKRYASVDRSSANGVETIKHATPLPSPLRVLDLGCGMGLAGMVAASIGCEVTFADLEPPALLFARYNALGVAPRARVRGRQLDWRTARLPWRFDVILGADILYERSQWEFLEPFWRAHLAPGGLVLLGEPGRQTGHMFVDWIGSYPWNVRHHSENVETRSTPIRLLELTATLPL